MKSLLILLDGLGDRSCDELKNLTPLQAATTPTLDRLAAIGSNGLFHASMPGQCLPSETAHYLLLGYDEVNFPGRGLLEAIGYGVEFRDEDVLCLAHLSCIEFKKGIPILINSRNDFRVGEKDIESLLSSISSFETDGILFELIQTGRNDAIIVLKGDVSPYISDSDPIVKGRPLASVCSISGNNEPKKAEKTARAMNRYLTYCHTTLKEHCINHTRVKKNLPPVNFLATQRCGRRIKQESFFERWGMKGILLASGAVYAGLAQELGLSFLKVKDTANAGNDLRNRIRIALDDTEHDFIHLHTKVPDEAAHKGDPRQKKKVIEALDRGLDELIEVIETENDLSTIITADHSTPTLSSLIHSGEPVPIMLVGPNIRRDDVNFFDEVSAAKGCLGLLRGKELMLTLLNSTDRSSLKGHNLGSKIRPYVSNNYDPFDFKME